MSIFRQFKRKIKGVEEIVDVGALAKNVTEDSTHRFVSDNDKQKWNAKLDSAGDIANAKVSFSQAASRANINTGESIATISGKLKKWYADFKDVVWSGSYNDLENKPSLGSAASQGIANNLTTTASGYAMDARQGPVIQQKFTQINSDLAGIQFDVDTKGNALARYNFDGELKTVNLGGGIMTFIISFFDADMSDIESKFRVGQDSLETIQQIGSEGTVTAKHELYDIFSAINKRIEAVTLEDESRADVVDVVLLQESKVDAEIRHLKTRISATEEVTDTLLMEQLV